MNLWHGRERGYSIQVRMAVSGEDDQGWSTAQTFKIPDENANSHIMIGLEEWMRYQVRVASYNRMGYSAYSSSAETTTRESGKTKSVLVHLFTVVIT